MPVCKECEDNGDLGKTCPHGDPFMYFFQPTEPTTGDIWISSLSPYVRVWTGEEWVEGAVWNSR